MSTALYRKYRPQKFSDVIGQQHIVQTLSNSLKLGRIGHAYLFTGPRGTGKTTLARIFANAVNCLSSGENKPCLKCENCLSIANGKSLDIFEIDAASNTGVDNIRELRENVKFPPTSLKYKVYIIDEVHMLSTGAFNALLKTLEEPPAHVIFILATTEIHKVPETIISRCQRFDFARLPVENILKKLSLIAKAEKVEIEKEALEMIAIAAEGGMRDAESLLSQVMSLQDKNITAKEVEEILGTTERQSLEELVNHILEKKTTNAISLINKLSQDGYDLSVFNKSFLNYLRQAMLVSVDQKLSDLFSYELTAEQIKSLIKQTEKHSPQEFLFIIQCFMEIQDKIKSAFIPQLPLEMAVIKALKNADETEVSTENDDKNQPRSSSNTKLSSFTKTTTPEAPEAPKMASNEPIEDKGTPIAPIKNEAEIKENKPAKPELNISLSEIKKCWQQVICETKPLNHSLSAILQSCQPTGIEKDFVVIAAKFPFHRDKLNETPNKLTLESVFAKILGLCAKVKVVTQAEAGIKSQQPAVSSQQSVKQEKPRETSSLLTDALNIMGGTVVE